MLHFRNSVPMSVIESEMALKSDRQLEAVGITGDPLERVRLVCLSRGDVGILNLGRMFRRLDHDGKKRLSEEKFIQGLRESGMEITKEEGNDIFQKFAVQNNGWVDIDEFLKAIRPPMSESRKILIEKAFNKMEKAGDGDLLLDELKNVYDIKYHPLYWSGQKNEETIFKRFMAHFKHGVAKDGHVTKEEFLNFYAAISASIGEDACFDLMMRQCYKL